MDAINFTSATLIFVLPNGMQNMDSWCARLSALRIIAFAHRRRSGRGARCLRGRKRGISAWRERLPPSRIRVSRIGLEL